MGTDGMIFMCILSGALFATMPTGAHGAMVPMVPHPLLGTTPAVLASQNMSHDFAKFRICFNLISNSYIFQRNIKF